MRALRLRLTEAQFRLCVLHLRKNGTTATKVFSTFIGQMDSASGAVQQGNAKLALERGQASDHGRQGSIESIRSRGEASLFHDPYKCGHGRKLIHSKDYYSII